MSARVGDFGISRLLEENTSKGMQNSYSSTGLRGSIGYVAPGICFSNLSFLFSHKYCMLSCYAQNFNYRVWRRLSSLSTR
jgi:hypothetical protein